MKKKFTKEISILVTMAMAISLLVANPFTGIQANAAEALPAKELPGIYYTGGVDGVEVYSDNPNGDSFLDKDILNADFVLDSRTSPKVYSNTGYTSLLNLVNSDSTTLKALCVGPKTDLDGTTFYFITTATNIDGRVINALYDVIFKSTKDDGSIDREKIAGAQAVIWNLENKISIELQYKTGTETVTVTDAVEAIYKDASGGSINVSSGTIYTDIAGNFFLYTGETAIQFLKVTDYASFTSSETGIPIAKDDTIWDGGVRWVYKDLGSWYEALGGGDTTDAYINPNTGRRVTDNILFKNGLPYIITEGTGTPIFIDQPAVAAVTEERDTMSDRDYKDEYDTYMGASMSRVTLNGLGYDVAYLEGPKLRGGADSTQKLITLIPYDYIPPVTPTVITDDTAILADAGEVLGATRRVSTDDVSGRWLALFGISALSLTGIVLKKKRDEHEVETV